MSDSTGWLLREARRRAGLTQRALAGRAGTTQSVVARIEHGQTAPTVRTLARLIRATGYQLGLELRPLVASDSLTAAYKPGIDRTLLRENLKQTPEQRVKALQDLHDFALTARRAGRTATKRARSAARGRRGG